MYMFMSVDSIENICEDVCLFYWFLNFNINSMPSMLAQEIDSYIRVELMLVGGLFVYRLQYTLFWEHGEGRGFYQLKFLSLWLPPPPSCWK